MSRWLWSGSRQHICMHDACGVCRVTLVTGPPAPAGPEPGGLSPSGGKQGSLADTLREVEPTSHMGVPRVWEKVMERIQEAVAQSGFIRRKMLLWAMSVMLEQNLTCPERYGGPGHAPVCNGGSVSAGLSRPSGPVRGPRSGWAGAPVLSPGPTGLSGFCED